MWYKKLLKFDFDFLEGTNKNESKNFKEDSVREEILDPLIKSLGFEFSSKNQSDLTYRRSILLKTPSVVGSNTKKYFNEKIDRRLFPDYVLYIKNQAICVIDAKSPNKNIKIGDAPQQAFFYAINPEIKASYYALCNGREFALFNVNGQQLILEIDLKFEFEKKFKLLKEYLTKNIDISLDSLNKENDEWYLKRTIPQAINPKKRKVKRYFGCTAYFTRQSWDVVQNHISNFTQEGDIVLDSFGGSGITAIEATMKGRVGIHIDLNPLSVFMTKALSVKVSLRELQEMGEEMLLKFEKISPKNEIQAQKILKTASYYPSSIAISSKTQGGGGHRNLMDSKK